MYIHPDRATGPGLIIGEQWTLGGKHDTKRKKTSNGKRRGRHLRFSGLGALLGPLQISLNHGQLTGDLCVSINRQMSQFNGFLGWAPRGICRGVRSLQVAGDNQQFIDGRCDRHCPRRAPLYIHPDPSRTTKIVVMIRNKDTHTGGAGLSNFTGEATTRKEITQHW